MARLVLAYVTYCVTLTFWWDIISLLTTNMLHTTEHSHQEYINPGSVRISHYNSLWYCHRWYWECFVQESVTFGFNYWRKRRGEKEMRKLSGPECVNCPILAHNKHMRGDGGLGGNWNYLFSSRRRRKVNCNFLRSVLLQRNEAFTLVDGVKLIFKIITGLLQGQDNKINSVSPLSLV